MYAATIGPRPCQKSSSYGPAPTRAMTANIAARLNPALAADTLGARATTPEGSMPGEAAQSTAGDHEHRARTPADRSDRRRLGRRGAHRRGAALRPDQPRRCTPVARAVARAASACASPEPSAPDIISCRCSSSPQGTPSHVQDRPAQLHHPRSNRS